jgi:hypothetical protein
LRCLVAFLLSCLVLFQPYLLGLSSLSLKAQAYENEAFWGKPSFEKKIFTVGQRILEKNEVKELIAFRIYKRRTGERANVNASAEGGLATVAVEDGLLKLKMTTNWQLLPAMK